MIPQIIRTYLAAFDRVSPKEETPGPIGELRLTAVSMREMEPANPNAVAFLEFLEDTLRRWDAMRDAINGDLSNASPVPAPTEKNDGAADSHG